ncbi:MAG: hypothetical protein ACNYPD_05380 [Candidatus Halichondribacter symbioticus]
MTLSLKNTIPALALLVAILMISGCGAKAALDNLADDAGAALNEFGDDLKKQGIESLSNTDPCREQSVLFGDRTLCDKPEHNVAREAQCTFEFNAALCADTVTRVCDANINKPLCEGKAGYATLHSQGLVIVDESDWRVSFLNEYLDVTPRGETPNPDVGTNLFLGNLTSDEVELARDYRITDVVLSGFEDEGEVTDGRRRTQERIFTIKDADAVGTLTLAHTQEQRSEAQPVFHGFKGINADGEETDTGDSKDGVSFVAGQFNLRSNCEGAACTVHRYYAGIHASTDLGAPLASAPASGTWRGFLRMVGQEELTSVPFDLDITFRRATRGGTIKADFDSAGRYVIDATFDSFGAITGDITIINSPGTISGIIGQEGAVAAFISNETGARDASSALGYAGGFVAYLVNPPSTIIPTKEADPCIKANTCVDYTHWAVATAANPTDAPTPDRFLKGTTRGLMGVDQSDIAALSSLANLNSRSDRRGDAEDGYAFYRPESDRESPLHNVGLFSTTNLGAPLSEAINKAQWPGLFHLREGTSPIITVSPITVTVDFNTANNTGLVGGTDRSGAYKFSAAFNAIGVISGGEIVHTKILPNNVITGGKGIVSGLIGAEGVVGVFHSDAVAKISFVGGFLALPPTAEVAPKKATVGYLDWVTAANPTDAPTPNRFLKGTPGGLSGVTGRLGGGMGLPGVAGAGVAIHRPDRDGPVHNVGIYSTTDLGAPLSDPITTAQWPGAFLDRSGTGLVTNSNITLTVTFDGTNGTIAGTNSRNDYALLDTTFNAVGVITGRIVRTEDNLRDTSVGVVSGLIGSAGAVGVFHSEQGVFKSYVGGFVASPPPPNG